MKKYKNLIKIAVLAVIFLVMVNPGWMPFLSSGEKNAISAQLKESFGILLGGTTGALSPARAITAVAAAALVAMLTLLAVALLELLARRSKRSEAISVLLGSLTKVVGAVAGLVWVLGILRVNLGAIFASLGIVSLIIGFGVQSLLEDCVTGIFIILEGTYHTGDIIVLDDYRGTVKKITMRTTTIEDAGGNLKIVNNSDIRNVQNRSNSISVAICDVSVSYEADLRQVEKTIAQALPEIYERNTDVFEAVPTYGGVQAMSASSVDLRYTVKAKEENIFAATRRMNREMKLLLDDSGIEIPYSQLVVHQAK